jgi:hypothetical protein
MASTAHKQTTAPLARSAAQDSDAKFFVWLAGGCVAIAVGGFMPTYWMQVPAGTIIGTPLMHLHGLLYTAWTLLLFTQCWLIEKRRYRNHRAWGLAGIALATMMVAVGTALALRGVATKIPVYGDRARAFAIVPLYSMVVFPLVFGLAIANVRNTEWHRRLIFVATAPLLGAALARVFFSIFVGIGPGMRPGLGAPLPVNATLAPVMLANIVIVAGMVHDWRTRGRPHPAWTIGLIALVTTELLRAPVASSQAWLLFTDWLMRAS